MPKNIKRNYRISSQRKELINVITQIVENKFIFSEIGKSGLKIDIPLPKNDEEENLKKKQSQSFNVKYLKNDTQLSNISFVCSLQDADLEEQNSEFEILHLNFEERSNL